MNRFWKFFDDVKAIIVERDPRDIYILEKLVWKGSVIPTDTVETFCKWYKYTRAHRKTEVFDPEHAMFIYFEDLIYHYEDTTAKLSEWLGLDSADHVRKFQGLDPAKSIKNTRLWLKYDIGKDLEVIERELAEYLYDYSEVKG